MIEENQLPQSKPVVILVEDDPSVYRSLNRLMAASGLEVRAFSSPSALLTSDIPECDACLVFDVYLPEMSGVALYETLAAVGCQSPLILITAGQGKECWQARAS
jgi:two-component system, LuxR family, response regulator FixJ